MLRPTITHRQARQQLDFLAGAYPDRVTTNQEYFNDNLHPTCIMGYLLEAFGADEERVSTIAGAYPPTVRVLSDDYGIFYADKRTLELLTRIQNLEDDGYTWRDAIEGGMAND